MLPRKKCYLVLQNQWEILHKCKDRKAVLKGYEPFSRELLKSNPDTLLLCVILLLISWGALDTNGLVSIQLNDITHTPTLLLRVACIRAGSTM